MLVSKFLVSLQSQKKICHIVAKKNTTDMKKSASQSNEVVTVCGHPLTVRQIEKMIFTIRGVQVMRDSDLAMLYGVETKVLNQAVKRNINRFPEDFLFQLTVDELNTLRSQSVTSYQMMESLRSQIVTSKRGGARYLPYVFTENGIAMLSSVLRSQTAVEINIQIMRAFTAMRHFLSSNAQVFQRLESIEKHQLITDQRIDQVFHLLESDLQPHQGIFFDGQIFDAYTFVSNLIRSAKNGIVLFDNYVDDTVLALLDKRKKKVSATIYTKSVSKQFSLDLAKHNEQYQPVEVKVFDKTHDRFLCIDNTVYHIGASLKDLGKKWFAFSKMEMKTKELLGNVK